MSLYLELTAGYAFEIQPPGGNNPARLVMWHDHVEMGTLSRDLTAREYEDLCESLIDLEAVRERVATQAIDGLRHERAEHEKTRQQLTEALDLLEGAS